MGVDPREVFGDALVAVCGSDDGRLGHAVDVVAITPDDRAAWCVGLVGATLVDVDTLRPLAQYSLDLQDRPIAAFARGRGPSEVTVVLTSGGLRTLDGARVGAVASPGVSPRPSQARFSRDGAVMVTAPIPGPPAPRVSVWAMRPFRLIREFAGEAPVAIDASGAVVAHGVAGWKGLGLGFTRVSDGVCVRRSLPAPHAHAAIEERGAVAWVAGDGLAARVPLDPAERITHVACVGPSVLLGATNDGPVRVSRHATGLAVERGEERVAEIARAESFVGALAPGGGLLFGVDLRAPYRVDLGAGAVVRGTAGHDVVRDVAWSPDGRHVATAATDGTLCVWDAATGARETLIEGGAPGDGVAVAWSRDGRALFGRGGDGALTEWSRADEMPTTRWPLRPVQAPRRASHAQRHRPRSRVVVSPDDDHVAVVDHGLIVVRRGERAAPIVRADITDAAWREDQPATLVTLAPWRSAWGTPWVQEDYRAGREVSRGALRTLLPVALAQDGRHVWCPDALGTAATGVRALRVDLDGMTDIETRALGAGGIDLIAAVEGRVVALAGRPGVGRRLCAAFAMRADVTSTPITLYGAFEAASLSPDGARLAVVLEGRVAILALPTAE